MLLKIRDCKEEIFLSPKAYTEKARNMNTQNYDDKKYYILYAMNQIFKIFVKRIGRMRGKSLFKLLWITVLIIILTLWMWNKEVIEQNTNNPVILWWTASFPGTSETRVCSNEIKCDVFSSRNISDLYNVEANLFYASNIKFDDLPLPRRPKEVLWGLYHEESPRNVEEMMHEDVLSLFNYSSTFSRFSDVPFPLQYLNSFKDITDTKYFVKTVEKNRYLKDISPIMYLQSDCETSTERDIYVKELMKYINIDSYGTCLNNKKLPIKFTEDYLNKLHDDDFLRFIARYKFVISIENGICNDYVTEKFWRAIKVGTVPIYFGSPIIKDWYPNNKSAILLEDYPTPESMSNYITKLINDDTLYESYLEHKTKGIIRNRKLLDEIKNRPYQIDALKTATEFECFVCEKLYQKRKGKLKRSIVNKNHYDCPKPISALNLQVNPLNSWAYSYETAKQNAASIRKKVMSGD